MTYQICVQTKTAPRRKIWSVTFMYVHIGFGCSLRYEDDSVVLGSLIFLIPFLCCVCSPCYIFVLMCQEKDFMLSPSDNN